MTSQGFNKYGGKYNEPIRPIFDKEVQRSTFAAKESEEQMMPDPAMQYENRPSIMNEENTPSHMAQHILPRPHHELLVKKQTSAVSDQMGRTFKSNTAVKPGVFSGGYQSDFTAQASRTVDQQKYEPIPDSRFYTKANFFTLKDQDPEADQR